MYTRYSGIRGYTDIVRYPIYRYTVHSVYTRIYRYVHTGMYGWWYVVCTVHVYMVYGNTLYFTVYTLYVYIPWNTPISSRVSIGGLGGVFNLLKNA